MCFVVRTAFPIVFALTFLSIPGVSLQAQMFGSKSNPGGSRSNGASKKENPSHGGLLRQFQNLKDSFFGDDEPIESAAQTPPNHRPPTNQLTSPRSANAAQRPKVEPFSKKPNLSQSPAPIVSAPSRSSPSTAIPSAEPVHSNRRSVSQIPVPPVVSRQVTSPSQGSSRETGADVTERPEAAETDSSTYSTSDGKISSSASSRRTGRNNLDSATSENRFEILEIETGPANDRAKTSISIEDENAPRVQRKTRSFEALPSTSEQSQPVTRPVPSNLTSSTKQLAQNVVNDHPAANSELHMGTPSVRLQCLGPKAIEIGKQATYQLQATNEGTTHIRGMLVRVRVPNEVELVDFESAGCESDGERTDAGLFVLWTVADLAPSQSRMLTLLVEPKVAKAFTFEFEYTLTPNVTQMQVHVQQPALTVSLDGPEETLYGKSEQYRLKVRNPGTAVAKEVSVSIAAETFGRSDAEVGDLGPGEERNLDVELTFMQTGTIQLAIEGFSSKSNVRASTIRAINVRKADLTAEWIVPPEQYLNAEAEYIVVVHNHGAVPCEQIKCTAQLPVRSQLLQVPKGMNLDGETLTWFIPRIEPNGEVQFALPLKLSEEGNNAFYIRTSGSAGGIAESTATTRVESVVDLKVQALAPNAPAPVGEPVEYVLVISNRGTKAATSVRAIMQFSEGIEPSQTVGHEGRVTPGQVVFEPIGFIGPGKEIRLTVVAVAEASGTHRFRAEVRCDDYEAPLVQEAATRFLVTGKRRLETAGSPK